jgi:regulator of sigma E protease
MRLTVLRNLRVVPVGPPEEGLETETSAIPGVSGLRVTGGTGSGGARVGDILFTAQGISGIQDGTRLALRELTTVEVEVTPVVDPSDGKGRMGVQISPAVVPLSLPPLAAISRGVMLTGAWMQAMVQGLAKMLVGQERLALAGPVKISEMSRDVSNQGADKFLLFMALLSINLGIINLLPIPALDGGRLLFIAAEAVRGKRVEPAREAVVHFVGFVLVIGLMIVLTAVELLHIGKP